MSPTSSNAANVEMSVLSKLLKMEQAKKMLKLSTLWNHNTKMERMSSKKRAANHGIGAFSSILEQKKAGVQGD